MAQKSQSHKYLRGKALQAEDIKYKNPQAVGHIQEDTSKECRVQRKKGRGLSERESP